MAYKSSCWVLEQRSKAKLEKLDVGICGPASKGSVQFRCVELQIFCRIAKCPRKPWEIRNGDKMWCV